MSEASLVACLSDLRDVQDTAHDSFGRKSNDSKVKEGAALNFSVGRWKGHARLRRYPKSLHVNDLPLRKPCLGKLHGTYRIHGSSIGGDVFVQWTCWEPSMRLGGRSGQCGCMIASRPARAISADMTRGLHCNCNFLGAKWQHRE